MKLNRLVIVALASGVFSMAGCHTTEGDWQHAQKERTSQAYETFVKRHPQSAHVKEAQEAIERLDFESAKRENTEAAYHSFLQKHPKGPDAGKAAFAIEELKWKISVDPDGITVTSDNPADNEGNLFFKSSPGSEGLIPLAGDYELYYTGTVVPIDFGTALGPGTLKFKPTRLYNAIDHGSSQIKEFGLDDEGTLNIECSSGTAYRVFFSSPFAPGFLESK